MADSIKTESQDYIRAGLPAPPPLILTNYIHGEFSAIVLPGAPAPVYLPYFIRGEFSHMFTARERSSLTGRILTKNFIYDTITSGWSHV